jgi:hypothetical protein
VDDFDPGWVAEDHYRMLSLSFTVRSTDATFAEAIAWHFAPFRRSTPEVSAFPVDLYVQEKDLGADPPLYSLFVGNALRYTQHDLGDVLAYAVWMLHAEVSARVRDFVLIHAGAVARDGGVMLLPARPDVGKSSLVLGLLPRGFSYLSDELAAIDPVTGRIYPFERRIGLEDAALAFFGDLGDRLEDRRGLGVSLPSRYVRPEDVGAVVSAPAEPRWVVFIGEDRSGPPKLTPLSKAETVERMAAHSTNLFRYADRGVILLARVAARTEGFELSGGSPTERAGLLDERFPASSI